MAITIRRQSPACSSIARPIFRPAGSKRSRETVVHLKRGAGCFWSLFQFCVIGHTSFFAQPDRLERMVKHLRLPTIFTALVVATHSLAAETKGAGSTFVSPVMTKWIDAYKAKTGNDVS